MNNAFSEGGKGAVELAELVVDAIANRPSRPVVFSYTDRDNIETKAEKVVRQVYGADGVVFSAAARKMLERVRQLGIEDYPVCIAKTQYSFSADAHAYGVPQRIQSANSEYSSQLRSRNDRTDSRRYIEECPDCRNLPKRNGLI